VLLFKVDGADWTVDLKKGGVTKGGASDAAATFTVIGEELLALVKGTETAQSLYQHGKLRVDGDVRYAHRLAFLKQLV